MCGRYLIDAGEKDISEIVAEAEKSIHGRIEQQIFKGGEIFPGSTAPVVTSNNGAQFMAWGFPNIISGQRPHINARSETAANLRTFSEAMLARRCIVIISRRGIQYGA